MKQIIKSVLTVSTLFAFICNGNAQVPNTWVQKADVGDNIINSTNPRTGCFSFSLGNAGYVGGGSDGYYYHKDLWAYDPVTNVWTQKADVLFYGLAYATAFTLGNKAYVGTGMTQMSASTNNFYSYDPSSNTWTSIANCSSIPRNHAFSFSINGKGYVGGGQGMQNPNDLWMYDPSLNYWTQKSPFNVNRSGQSAFVASGKAYLVGGDGYGLPLPTNVEEYNPLTNSWANKNPSPFVLRSSGVAIGLGNTGYYGTGRLNYPTLRIFINTIRLMIHGLSFRRYPEIRGVMMPPYLVSQVKYTLAMAPVIPIMRRWETFIVTTRRPQTGRQ